MRPASIAGPLVLIVVGTLFLLNNIWIDMPLRYLFRNFWPLVLVVVGVIQMAAALSGRRGSLSGGVILITLGGLFLLQQLWNIGLGRSWPVLLIAIGAIGLVRAMAGPALSFGRARYMKGGLPR
jgi:hypothetical protein